MDVCWRFVLNYPWTAAKKGQPVRDDTVQLERYSNETRKSGSSVLAVKLSSISTIFSETLEDRGFLDWHVSFKGS